MFDFIKKQKEAAMYAPMDGIAVKLSQVPDEAFSEKILGDGGAVIPENGVIYSPIDGEIIDITDTKHAFCITGNDGTEVLLHVGIDTVKLKGEGFKVNIVSGDKVKAGQVLCLIEAMKMMSEITAPRDGVIKEIYVKNQDVVGFEEQLFLIGD